MLWYVLCVIKILIYKQRIHEDMKENLKIIPKNGG